MSVNAKTYVYNTPIVSQNAYENHLKLYTGYVNKLNEIDTTLINDPEDEKSNSAYSHYRGLKEGETFTLDAIILHELYFENLGNIKSSPNVKTLDMFKKVFGTVTQWQEDFTACAKSARGWACLIYEQRTNTFRNIMLDAHNIGNITHSFPIVILDMYEHAYFMDYGTDKDTYISRFLEYLDWDTVAQRMVKLYI